MKKTYVPTWPVPVDTQPERFISDPEPMLAGSPPVSMIAGSFSRDKLIELCEMHKYRGTYAYSIATYDVENHGMFSVNRGYGVLDYHKISISPHQYCIVQLQATPTRNIQPASKIVDQKDYFEHYLWFNGSLTNNEVGKIQLEEDTTERWQAMLLLKRVMRYGAPVDVDGAFSCVYSDGKELYLFRNELEPMFRDEELTICTTPFKGSVSTSSNKMFRMDLKKKGLRLIEEFTTIRHWV
jgi:hypothetical protein